MSTKEQKQKPRYVVPAKSDADVQRVLALRNGSTTDPHDTRPRRQRTRADAKRAAIREW